MLFPNIFMEHYLQIEYDLHILNLANEFWCNLLQKYVKYEHLLILLITMSFDAFLKNKLFSMKRSEFKLLFQVNFPHYFKQRYNKRENCTLSLTKPKTNEKQQRLHDFMFQFLRNFWSTGLRLCDTGDMETDHHNRWLSALNYKIWGLSYHQISSLFFFADLKHRTIWVIWNF